MQIRLTDEINPHFYPFWRSKKPYLIAKGGRGSFKSSVISLKLLTMMKKHIANNEQANVICIRENASYLRDSVYRQIEEAMSWLHCTDEFKFRNSPMTITHIRTGSTFYFYGANDPQKLKSNTVNNVIGVWFEECANLKSPEVFDQSIPTFIRNKAPYMDHVPVFYSYNPPRNPYHWINEWVADKENDPDYFVDYSTYLDDKLGFTTKQTLDLINKYKKNDYDYYRWLYLGEVVGLGTNVYNMKNFHRLEHVPFDDPITNIYFSVDTGHEVSATTCSCYGLTYQDKVILLDTYYYSPAGKVNKKPPSELAGDLMDFIQKQVQKYDMEPTNMTIDSAEGALDNQFYSEYGIRWQKVHKLKKVDMVDRVHDLLGQGRFYYLDIPANSIFIDEHKRYQWDENTLQSDNPEVIKEHDHTCDQFQYFCLSNESDLDLRY